uniref:Uncharacterized protein n=1 Tax=Strigamia maritima TaxID=126957 RepID=T1JE34_STRMM
MKWWERNNYHKIPICCNEICTCRYCQVASVVTGKIRVELPRPNRKTIKYDKFYFRIPSLEALHERIPHFLTSVEKYGDGCVVLLFFVKPEPLDKCPFL